MVEYFVDTCVIICYATNISVIPGIEPYGAYCEMFFEDNCDKISSKNVKNEVERVKRKRLNLYKNIVRALSQGKDVREIKVNDKKLQDHLDAILEKITVHDRITALNTFRMLGYFFDNRVKDALGMIEVIDVDDLYKDRSYEKRGWEDLLGGIIGNRDDGKIVIDCIILSHYRGHLILVTLDRKDVINNKDKILKFAEDYCSISINPSFDICHLSELYS